MSGFWSYSPCLWFSSPWRVATHEKIYDFLPHKAIKQYIFGLNSIEICCSDQILPFGTIKRIKSSKISFFFFFSFWFFSPSPNLLILFSPPGGRGGNTQFNYIQACFSHLKKTAVNTSETRNLGLSKTILLSTRNFFFRSFD